MVEVNAGDQLWVIVKEGEEGLRALDKEGVLEDTGAAVSVVVVPATVLEGGKTAQLANGETFDLLPDRTYDTIEEAEEAAENLAKKLNP